MTVNLVRSGSLYTGVPYAYASVAVPGALIFTAGACPLDDRGEVVGAGDVRAQASLAVANLATALAEGMDLIEATEFACAVAGISVTRHGTAPNSRMNASAARSLSMPIEAW